jgi:hypothetical protein
MPTADVHSAVRTDFPLSAELGAIINQHGQHVGATNGISLGTAFAPRRQALLRGNGAIKGRWAKSAPCGEPEQQP